MAQQYDDDAVQRLDANAEQQWGTDGNGHAKSSDALQKAGEDPAKDQDLQQLMPGQGLDALADGLEIIIRRNNTGRMAAARYKGLVGIIMVKSLLDSQT